MLTELVTAAMKSMKNHSAPKTWPAGMRAKTGGSAMNPRLKLESSTSLVRFAAPRNRNATGTVIRPPRHTSQNSFVALAVKPDRTTSSDSRR